MKNLIITLCLFFIVKSVEAQFVFVQSAKITFEKKYNNKLASTDMNGILNEANNDMPKFSTSYWELAFNDSTSVFKPLQKNDKDSEILALIGVPKDNSELYTNLTKNKRVFKKSIIYDEYIYEDTIPKVKWKIVDEVRKIAGYNCRKAIGVINGDVYVVAFYTVDILLKGGPEGFTGLPGLILGLAIPQYYTTWFATEVKRVNATSEAIVPPDKGIKTNTEKEWKKFVESASQYFPNNKKPSEKEIKDAFFGFLLST